MLPFQNFQKSVCLDPHLLKGIRLLQNTENITSHTPFWKHMQLMGNTMCKYYTPKGLITWRKMEYWENHGNGYNHTCQSARHTKIQTSSFTSIFKNKMMSESFTGGILYLQNCDRCNTLYHLQLCFNMHNIATGLKWQLWQHSLCHIIWKLLKNISIINIPTNLKCELLQLMQFALKEGHLTLFFFFKCLNEQFCFLRIYAPKTPKRCLGESGTWREAWLCLNSI